MKLSHLRHALLAISPEQEEAFEKIMSEHHNIIILGNGGSNAIAQHIAQDYTKVLEKHALCFADASRLTCYINDYGMANAYAKFIEHFADKDALVILISSSGESKNIVNAALYCSGKNLHTVILTGFSEQNYLRSMFGTTALLELHVASDDYGVVELTHEAFLHTVC